MQSAKVIAKKLVTYFKPSMYCYLGSGMLTNDYNEKVALDNAKYCAIKCAKEMQKMFKAGWDSFGPDHSVTDTEEYWILRDVPKEIKKL